MLTVKEAKLDHEKVKISDWKKKMLERKVGVSSKRRRNRLGKRGAKTPALRRKRKNGK